MIEQYIVEGGNFVGIVPIDLDVCDNPGMEAATLTLEHIFRPEHKMPNGFKFLSKQDIKPIIGGNLYVWRNGDIGDDKRMHIIPFVTAARNAGLLDVVKLAETI